MKKEVQVRVFLPFLLQSVACFIYFTFFTKPEKHEWKITTMILEGLIFITTVWFLYIECLQIKQHKCSSRYWLDLTNFVDLFSSVLNISLILLNWTSSENELIKVGAMIAVYFVWYKTFYWMRLYKQPAFLMNLLMKTLDAIVPFTIMSVILLMMFSNMLYIID